MLLKAGSHSASDLNMISLYKVKTNISNKRLLHGGRFYAHNSPVIRC